MVLHQFVRVLPYGNYNRDKYPESLEKKLYAEAEYEDGYVQHNKHKYDEENQEKYQDAGHWYYDKDKKKLLLEGFDIVKEKYQDGYGDYYNRNKDKYYGGLNAKENCQNGYDHPPGNFNKDKYKENNKFYDQDGYGDYYNRNRNKDKLGPKVNAKGKKVFQDFDDLGYNSNIHYSDHDQVHSGIWSVVAHERLGGRLLIGNENFQKRIEK